MRSLAVRGGARVAFGIAALMMPLALIYIPLEVGSREIVGIRGKVEKEVAEATSMVSRSGMSCRGCNEDSGLCPLQAWRLAAGVQSSITELGLHAFGNELLMELSQMGLPLGEGFKETRAKAYALDDAWGALDNPRDFCRDPDPEFGALMEEAEGRLARMTHHDEREEREELRKAIRKARADRLKEPDGREYAAAWKAEEARSQAVYAEIRGKLVEHQAALERAWKQFERDRPKVAAVAWTLGILEVVGWALGLAILPGEIRTLKAQWRARREARKPS